MASQESIEKMLSRQNYRNLWHTDLLRSIQADTPCKDSLSLTHTLFQFSLSIFTLTSFLILRRLLPRVVVVCDLELSLTVAMFFFVNSCSADLMIVLFSLKFCSFGRGIESLIFTFAVYHFRVIELALTLTCVD